MVRHAYEFDASGAAVWFGLLCKYYPMVKASAVVDGVVHSGSVCTEWFADLPTGHNYLVEIESMSCEAAAVRAMPRFAAHAFADSARHAGQDIDAVRAIAEAINAFASARLQRSQKSAHASRPIAPARFEQVIAALGQLDKDAHVTRVYVSRMLGVALLVLDERHAISITMDRVSTTFLPTLDLDAGFEPHTFGSAVIARSWSDAFAAWKVRFKTTGGGSWDDAILPELALFLSCA